MFTFYTDPGHGWLEVSAADLRGVNLSAASFSRFSYRKGADLYYLEEDCDAGKFLAAWEAKHNRKPDIRDVHQEHTFIRNLPRIS